MDNQKHSSKRIKIDKTISQKRKLITLQEPTKRIQKLNDYEDKMTWFRIYGG